MAGKNNGSAVLAIQDPEVQVPTVAPESVIVYARDTFARVCVEKYPKALDRGQLGDALGKAETLADQASESLVNASYLMVIDWCHELDILIHLGITSKTLGYGANRAFLRGEELDECKSGLDKIRQESSAQAYRNTDLYKQHMTAIRKMAEKLDEEINVLGPAEDELVEFNKRQDVERTRLNKEAEEVAEALRGFNGFSCLTAQEVLGDRERFKNALLVNQSRAARAASRV